MNDIRTDSNGVMLRPSTVDICVKRRAAEMALPQVKVWLRYSSMGPVTETDEEIIRSLMPYLNGSDGFEIAKAMERDGWCPNSALVDIMDSGFIEDALRELTMQWVRCLGVTLRFDIGQTVKWRGSEYVISKRMEDTAEYGVRTEDMSKNSYYHVKAEDLKPVAEKECAA